MTPLPEAILSAETLRITDAERTALIKVRELLASGALAHKDFNANARFNMNVAARRVQTPDGCGTVACIGGWMSIMLQLDAGTAELNDDGSYHFGTQLARDYVESQLDAGSESTLFRLFYPGFTVNYDQITPADAVTAIDRYLTTGKPGWGQAEPVPVPANAVDAVDYFVVTDAPTEDN